MRPEVDGRGLGVVLGGDAAEAGVVVGDAPGPHVSEPEGEPHGVEPHHRGSGGGPPRVLGDGVRAVGEVSWIFFLELGKRERERERRNMWR